MADQASAVTPGLTFAQPADLVPESRRRLGWIILAAGSLVLAAIFVVQALFVSGFTSIGFANWQPLLYAYLVWGIALGISEVLRRGEDGYKALFVLPAVLFTVAMVIFPTLFGLYIAFTDWNLS